MMTLADVRKTGDPSRGLCVCARVCVCVVWGYVVYVVCICVCVKDGENGKS